MGTWTCSWVAMSRIDSIRRILFGGHRRIDTATTTVLERSYLPHDAHSWAKHYAGVDLPKLTPFKSATGGVAPAEGSLDYYCDEGTAYTAPGVVNPLCKDPDNDPNYYACTAPYSGVCASTTDPYNFDCAANTKVSDPGYTACKDVSVHDPRYRRNRRAYVASEDYQDSDWDGTPVNRKRLGVTFGNTTDVNASNYKSNEGSEKYREPPLIKAVRENYSLWASNERWQVTWASGAPIDNHSASNGNDPKKSLIPAYATSPAWSNRMGQGNYIARVQACVPGLIDSSDVAAVAGSTKEKCKLYPGPDGAAGTADDNYKPIGLLQAYGEKLGIDVPQAAAIQAVESDPDFASQTGQFDRNRFEYVLRQLGQTEAQYVETIRGQLRANLGHDAVHAVGIGVVKKVDGHRWVGRRDGLGHELGAQG